MGPSPRLISALWSGDPEWHAARDTSAARACLPPPSVSAVGARCITCKARRRFSESWPQWRCGGVRWRPALVHTQTTVAVASDPRKPSAANPHVSNRQMSVSPDRQSGRVGGWENRREVVASSLVVARRRVSSSSVVVVVCKCARGGWEVSAARAAPSPRLWRCSCGPDGRLTWRRSRTPAGRRWGSGSR